MASRLIAGPWVGEFGWELFCWQGYLRKLSRQFDHTTVTCRKGHDVLYTDFANEIQHYSPKHEETDMCYNRKEKKLIHSGPKHLQYETSQGRYYTRYIPHDQYSGRWWDKESWQAQQELIPFGSHGKHYVPDLCGGYDILLIIRNTDKCNTGFRNWDVDHAALYAHHMRTLGYSVACVGEPTSAISIPEYPDYRGYPLDLLSNLMSCAKVIVGPQCGPTHFATLCGLPQVSWQTKREHAYRMQFNWNPFQIPVITLSAPSDRYWRKRQSWTPQVQDIVEATHTVLNTAKENQQ